MSVQSKLLETAIDPEKRRRVLLIVAGGVAAVVAAQWISLRKSQKSHYKLEKEDSVASDGTPKKNKKRAFDPHFLKQLKELLKIMVPGIFSKEAGIIGEDGCFGVLFSSM